MQDYHSEKYVQETLDRASEGRTTIVVSHRMSAIKDADRIVFIDKGKVVEDGTHSELIAANGRYYDMVKSTHEELEKSDGSPLGEETNQGLEVKQSKREGSYVISEIVDEASTQERDTVKYWKSFKRILRLVKSDWIILTTAVVSSIVLGFSLPLFAVIFSETYGVSSKITFVNICFSFIKYIFG